MNAAKNLGHIWFESWRPPDRRPPWEWAEDHVHSIPYSPVPGRFRADNSPWLKEPLEALVDARVRVISIIASIQSSKTTVGELGLCYIIANFPGPTLWLDQTDDDARDQAESRLGPLFEECPPVKALFPGNRHRMKTATKHFSNGMTLWVLGANNKTNLQRRSIRWLICDETWRMPPGHMAEAEARVTAFGWLGKCLFLSQGGEEHDDTHRKFETTDQREWSEAELLLLAEGKLWGQHPGGCGFVHNHTFGWTERALDAFHENGWLTVALVRDPREVLVSLASWALDAMNRGQPCPVWHREDIDNSALSAARTVEEAVIVLLNDPDYHTQWVLPPWLGKVKWIRRACPEAIDELCREVCGLPEGQELDGFRNESSSPGWDSAPLSIGVRKLVETHPEVRAWDEFLGAL